MRPASGLVREVSTSKALFFNIGAAIAWMPAWTVSYTIIVPAYLVWGWSSWSWGILITGIYAMFVLAPIFAYLSTALPRSGGDQIYTTRITNPLLGFLETWTFVFSIFAFMGWGLSVLVLTLGSTFSVMAISTPEPWNSYASWFGTQTGLVIVGTVVMALVVIVSMQPAKRFHTANSVIVGVGLILSALMLPFLGTLDATTFARNLQAITGKSVKDVLDMAAAGGFSIGTYDPTTLGIVLGVALTGFIGFQFSGFLAGELKGNVSRNVLTSMMGACLIGILCQTVFLQAFAGTLGFDFVTALSYLYYGNPSGTPIPAITQAFIAVSSPGLAPLMAISVVGSFLIGFSLCITWVATATRAAFAWAMDRLIPTSLSVINSRTKSPLRLTILFSALWYVFYILSISGVGVLTGIYVSALLALLVWIMPGFNALLLPYRRPELYELIPRSMRKKFGIPLVSILGIISILFTVAVYFMYAVWPLFSGAYGLHGAEVIDYAMSTGSSTFVIVVVAGIILYYASRWYNARHGIDMSLLYKSVPPE